jgi:uncharacterized protein YbaP (TraB family)
MKNCALNPLPRTNAKRIFLVIIGITISLTSAVNAKCFVWRVVGSKAPCYLVGTVHALSSSDYPRPKPYEQALNDSQRLVFECAFDPQSNFNKKLGLAMSYPVTDRIQRHVHPKTWQIINANFANGAMMGQDGWVGGNYLRNGIQQLKAWGIAWIFYGIPGFSDLNARGVDDYLGRKARIAGKERLGLETEDEHVEVVSGFNDIESELVLLEAIKYRDKMRGENKADREAWKRGDTAAIWASNQRTRNLNPGANLRLLDMRNVKWVPKIRAQFESGVPTSIVVGCAHMLGPNGLIALLERNGFKFEQL